MISLLGQRHEDLGRPLFDPPHLFADGRDAAGLAPFPQLLEDPLHRMPLLLGRLFLGFENLQDQAG
jgi:hypothetical protein